MATPSNNTAIPTDPLSHLPKLPALDNTFGAVLLGTFVGLILYGLTLHQSYRYYRMYPGDSSMLKTLVTVVLTLETFKSAISMHVCYHYLVSSYFTPEALLHSMWSFSLYPVLSGLIMITTQSFFARRVYVLDRRFRFLVAFAVLLCVMELGFFLAATVQTFMMPAFKDFRHFVWLISTGFTMAVTSDILLTAVLIFALHRSRTGVKRTDSMLDIMIMYSINTGLLTGVFNLLSLVLAFIRPEDMIYVGVGTTAVRMYSISIMAALNSRKSLAAKGSATMYDTSPFGFSIHPETHLSGAGTSNVQRPRAQHAVPVDPTATTDSVVLELTTKSSELARGSSIDMVKDLERQQDL